MACDILPLAMFLIDCFSCRVSKMIILMEQMKMGTMMGKMKMGTKMGTMKMGGKKVGKI